jgi:two-component system, OmpR family, phosphate regulon sensor histidine kinase PhoR
MNFLLVLGFLAIAVFYLHHRRRTRRHWRQIRDMIEAIAEGRRPATFIQHDEREWQQIALGLEKLTTQRDRLEGQISREGFNLQAILSSMTEGVMIVDVDRVIRLANRALLDFFNLKTAPVNRGALQTLRNAEIDAVLRDAIAQGEPQSREIDLSAPARHLTINAAPVRDSSGAILGVAATFYDLTRIRQLEQVRQDFVANVSHELRTPLSIFQGYVEMLRDNPGLPKQETAAALDVLFKHSRRLNLLVEDLLTLARLESREHEQKIETITPATFLEGVKKDWMLKFQAAGILLELELGERLPGICGDAFQLEQVFNNLLENALKYTPSGGRVAIRAARATMSDGGAELEIQVADTGSGIPAADLPHIFERFYRADKARSRALGGTGLGLSIVKHIIQSHNGSVHAESRVGEGSTFVLRLPA